MSSRSEIKVLLEELSTYKSGEESKEEFPDLLLSSLDKLYNDKQQQLWLVYDDKEIKSNYIILLIFFYRFLGSTTALKSQSLKSVLLIQILVSYVVNLMPKLFFLMVKPAILVKPKLRVH